MDNELTHEEENKVHLVSNPGLELLLWREWIETFCCWENITPPTIAEWGELGKNWQHGKTPAESVEELKELRK